jgi:hypothetical protein
MPVIARMISAGWSAVLFCLIPSDMYVAATPAAKGVENDVPLDMYVAVSDPIHAERIFTPGANRFTHGP